MRLAPLFRIPPVHCSVPIEGIERTIYWQRKRERHTVTAMALGDSSSFLIRTIFVTVLGLQGTAYVTSAG